MQTVSKNDARKSTTPWPENRHILRLARRTNRCNVLGPGTRAAIWLQGCPFRCPGCIAPENLPFQGGQIVDVTSLADELASLPDIEGVTFSGGEPFAQAAALVTLVDSIRLKRDLSFLSFSGYTLKHLCRHGNAAQRDLIARLDILVDGRYIAGRHTDHGLKGSDNQIVHLLTPRYRHLEQQLQEHGNSLEFEFGPDGGLSWIGIPPKGFREAFERKMQERGVSLTISK